MVGAAQADFPPIDRHSQLNVTLCLSDRSGLTSQRNCGLRRLDELGLLDDANNFVVFFDDDFRPASTWLSHASAAFSGDRGLAGLTGQVLADGVKGDAISEADAQDILLGQAPPRRHWSSGPAPRSVESLYGCNMAVTAAVAKVCRFDDELPLYGWQEDCDLTGQARRLGDTRIEPLCQGVHLGVKSSRSSGLRLGYSQVANPIRVFQRRNMSGLRMVRFIGRAFAANLLKTLVRRRTADYPGRLRGNLLAFVDLARGRCSPGRILLLGRLSTTRARTVHSGLPDA